MSVFRNLSPYFKFTPKEQKGVIVLIVLLVLVILTRVIAPIILMPDNANEVTIEVIQLLEEKEEKQKKEWDSSTKGKSSSVLIIDTSIFINPNNASQTDLLKLGFSEFSASNLIKYRNKGGHFYDIKDLFSIYGIDKSHLTSIQNNLIFDTIKVEVDFKQHTFQLIEINQSDAESLCIIPCVGPVISKRIIKYRSLLGGYYSLKQIKEVYGIDSTCLNNIAKYIEVDFDKLSKMNLNTVNEKELARHPYISIYQAKAIVKYRELIAPFDCLEQLKDNYILTQDEFLKVASYLSCGPI